MIPFLSFIFLSHDNPPNNKLDWPKSFCEMIQKNANELFGQPSIIWLLFDFEFCISGIILCVPSFAQNYVSEICVC